MTEISSVPVAVATAVPVEVPVAKPVPAAPVVAGSQSPGDLLSPSIGTNQWNIPLITCCSGKDCCTPNGCIQECCCGLCVWSSAVSHSEIDPFGMNSGMGTDDKNTRKWLFCLAVCCEVVPCQSLIVRTIVRLTIAKKYGIQEDLLGCVE